MSFPGPKNNLVSGNASSGLSNTSSNPTTARFPNKNLNMPISKPIGSPTGQSM